MDGFANASRAPQYSLFGSGEDRLDTPERRSRPREERVREKVTRLLETARTAERMPFTPRQIAMWRTVLPNMTTALPADEADRVQAAFAREIERLSRAG